MNAPEIQRLIISEIQKIVDVERLNKIYGDLTSKNNDAFEFSDEQLAILKEREREMDEGDFVNNEDAKAHFKKWLNQ